MLSRRKFTALAASCAVAAPGILRAQEDMRVVVIGAGAAGLTAGYHLSRAGVDVQVLEASPRWGGRMMRLSGFSDVPLDLGAEWIHDEPSVLGEIIGEGADTLGVETIEYRPQTYQFRHNGRLRDFDLLRHAYAEVKFLDTTWYGFFERFLLPEIKDRLRLNAAVARVDLSGGGVVLHMQDGTEVAADRVVMTVPISMLQRGQITIRGGDFDARLAELRKVNFGVGFKLFLKFRERFYPDILFDGPRSTALSDSWNEKTYYDAAFGKPTAQNILGLFTAWETDLPRARLDDAALLEDVLRELQGIYGDGVRENLLSAKVQNWTRVPFIEGSYSMTNSSDAYIEDILAPLDDKLYFAGEALGGDAQSTVHGAAFSAIDAVERLLG